MSLSMTTQNVHNLFTIITTLRLKYRRLNKIVISYKSIGIRRALVVLRLDFGFIPFYVYGKMRICH